MSLCCFKLLNCGILLQQQWKTKVLLISLASYPYSFRIRKYIEKKAMGMKPPMSNISSCFAKLSTLLLVSLLLLRNLLPTKSPHSQSLGGLPNQKMFLGKADTKSHLISGISPIFNAHCLSSTLSSGVCIVPASKVFPVTWCMCHLLLHLLSGGRCSFLSLFVSDLISPPMCFLIFLSILLFILVVSSGNFMVLFTFVIPYILFVLNAGRIL